MSACHLHEMALSLYLCEVLRTTIITAPHEHSPPLTMSMLTSTATTQDAETIVVAKARTVTRKEGKKEKKQGKTIFPVNKKNKVPCPQIG